LKSTLAKLAVKLLQWGFVLAIVAYLVRDIYRNDSLPKLWNEPKQWHLLAAALLVTLSAVTLTIVRWHWLMRAHDLPLRMRDALRLGFLGYLLNFVSFGAVGGDLFKAILAARECHGRRTEAVATVILDRLIGLFIVFVLASVAILATGAWRGNTDPWLQAAFRATLICTAVGTVGGGLLLLPDFSRGGLLRLLGALPKIGPFCVRMTLALLIYRSKLGVMAASLMITLVAQTLFVLAYFLVASGLSDRHPSLGSHFVIAPLVTIAGVAPLPANGLGTIELLMNYLYTSVTRAIQGEQAALAIPPDLGVLVSLGYRIVTLIVALVGVGYYLTARREVAQMMHEVESEHVHSLLDAAADAESESDTPPK